jgi:hypothetical protein
MLPASVSLCAARALQAIGKRLACSGAFALALALAGCVMTLTEAQYLQLDAAASKHDPTVDEDQINVQLTTWPEGRVTRSPGNFLVTGPYTIWIQIWGGRRSEAFLTAVEVSEAVLEIRYDGVDVRRLALSTARNDWKRFPYTDGTIRQWIPFSLAKSKTPDLDVDFERLKEIRFQLKFTGIYANGDRRDYWVEQSLMPKSTTTTHAFFLQT